jgi:hypothetical protein
LGAHALAADDPAVLVLDAVLRDRDVGRGDETAEQAESEKKATHCCCSPVRR